MSPRMLNRREVAQRLDISIEMAARHEIPDAVSEADVAALEQDPPAWLAQSRANRKKGGRPVWATLTCDVCGDAETVRPKKWWPEFTHVICDEHPSNAAPAPAAGTVRSTFDGVGSRFIGFVDAAL